MSSLNDKILAKNNPKLVGPIRGKDNMVPGERYVLRYFDKDERQNLYICDLIFTFEGKVDDKFFQARGLPWDGPYSFADSGIEPYYDEKGMGRGWNKNYCVLPAGDIPDIFTKIEYFYPSAKRSSEVINNNR